MASELRVNKLTNRSGLGTVTYTDTGAIVSGILTATSFSGGLPIPNEGNDRIITSSGSGAVNAEANLQFDGTNLFMPNELRHLGDPDTKIGFDTDTIKFETAGGERVRITSAGKVGIGSVTPGATLDLQSADTEVLLRLNTKSVKNGYLDIVSDANRRGVIRFQDSLTDGGNIRWSIGNGDSDELTNTSFHISTGNSGGNTAKLVIDSNGDVGINQSNPTQKLHVDGNILLTGQLMQSTPADFWSQGNTFIELNGMGNLTHMGGYETCLTSNGYRDTNAQWKSYATNSTTGASQIRLNPTGYIVFGTESNKANGSTHTVTERLRIDSSGNICGASGVINLKHPTGSGNVTVNVLGSSGDARIDLENTGNGNYSGIDFVRQRASGTGVIGGAIFMKSNTSNNQALLYIQAQSASAGSPETGALAANNGVRLLLEGGAGKFGISNGDTERFIINAAGKCHIGLPATTSSWDTNSISLTTNSATFACPATVAIFGGTGFGTANMAGGGIRFVGYYDSSNFTTFAHVAGVKENTTSGNYAGALTFHTRANGGLGAERLRVTSGGNLLVGRPSDYWSSRAIFQEDKNGRTQVLVKNDNNHASASSCISMNAYGNSWVIDVGSSLKNSNALTFSLDASSATPSEKVRITSGGQLCLGTTSGPGQIGLYLGDGTNPAGHIYANGTHHMYMLANAYHDGAWKYLGNGEAQSLSMADGVFSFHTAGNNTSGAGNGVTWQTRLSISADQNIYIWGNETGNNRAILYNGSGYFGIYGSSSSSVDRQLRFHSGGGSASERMRLSSDGFLLLNCQDTGFSSGYTDMTIGNTSASNTGLTIASSSTNGYSRIHFADGNSGAARYAGFIAYNHGTDELLFGTGNSGSHRVNIQSNGNTDFLASQVHLYNSANTSNTYFVAQNTGVGNAGIKMKNSQGEWTIIANDRLRFIDDDAGSETLSIHSGGKIGINYTGTPPSEDLMVRGTGSTGGITVQHLSGGNSYGCRFATRGSTNTGFKISTQFNSSYAPVVEMNGNGQICLSPAGGTSVSTPWPLNLISQGNSPSGVYPGLCMKSTSTGGGNGMAIMTFDNNWDLYTRSYNQTGIGILKDAGAAASGNAVMTIGYDGKVCLGTEVYANLSTSRDSYTALHIAGGGLSIGPKGNNSATRQGGRYVLGWYMMSSYTGHTYIHVVTDLWGGGSPSGNTDYIMGGFHIHGHAYTSSGQSEERIYFHNWNGNLHGHSRGQWGAWNPGNQVYVNSSGWVTLRLQAGAYKGYIIDLVQHAWYGPRDIQVTAHTGSNSSTI